ncbi:putative dynamin GTPase [Hypoxylon sp. NC1633]|nr:putative dynamin GTPase [Hypoxylon sp. NC1633]
MAIGEDLAHADGLGSAQSMHLLNLIDKIRANGVGDSISLPQIVVGGDQSSGKSSILERLTGIPFPRQEGLCTRFPTEFILRRSSETHPVIATIQPHAERSPELRDELKKQRWQLSELSELPGIIEKAGTLMLKSGHGTSETNASFTGDILRIEVRAPTSSHLTIVDLPGLISVPSEKQTENDVRIVQELVEGYISSSRTIILAVIQAPNDIANQKIVQLARKHDPEGRRTVGILTKPDLINEGTEPRIATLAKNMDAITFKLGVFLLKNPSPVELERGLSSDAQCEEEIAFFSRTVWKEQQLDKNRIGVEKLKPFLQDLLQKHIERELPQVRDEIRKKLTEVEEELRLLGPERQTVGQIRSFLTDVSMQFYQLAEAACGGSYQGATAHFFSEPDTRLRASVHHMNMEFSDLMRDNGGMRQMNQHADETKANAWLREVYHRTRGLELPGNHNHAFLAELFHEESSLWPTVAVDHVQRVVDLISEWISRAVSHSVRDDHLRPQIEKICSNSVSETKRLAFDELGKLIDDENIQPITYNHYYTDNVQKSRSEISRKKLEDVISSVVRKPVYNLNQKAAAEVDSEYDVNVIDKLQEEIVVDMVEQACNEATTALNSYYKVAMKTFVDNVCRQVIERHLLTPLPKIFCPQVTAKFSDEELLRIGSEPQQQRDKRAQLEATAQGLRKSLVDLQGSSVKV